MTDQDDISEAGADSFGMNSRVGRGRGRGSGRIQVSSKVDRSVYGSTPQVVRKSLNYVNTK